MIEFIITQTLLMLSGISSCR